MLCRRGYVSVVMVLAACAAAGCGSSRHAAATAGGHDAATGLVPASQLGAPGGKLAPAPRSSPSTTKAIAALAGGALATALDHLPRGTSAVAWAAAGPVSVYARPTRRAPQRRFPTHNPFGIRQVFLVKRATAGWLEVYLPVRPNDSTGWVRSRSVTLTVDPYSVVIDTARHKLTALRSGRPVMHATVGIGKPATPTPHGLFYVLEELRMVPATGPYGTYAIGVSAYSNVLKTFGSGPGQVAVHGTNDPASIGQATSNGCVHLSDGLATWLGRTLPLGTPVRIV
jgi:lipoprotein-anchoring transpeptidase ErfK/SrfK